MKLAFLVLFLVGNFQGGFLPTKKGTRWVYRSGSQEVVQTVLGTENIGGVSCVLMETRRGSSRERTWIQNSRSGLLIRRVMSRGQVNDLRVPATLLKMPFRKGDRWSARIPFGNDVVEYSYTNLGSETVRVPAGQFVAWKIKASGRVSGSRFEQTSWYANKTGWLVKQTTGGRSMELKSFSR